MMWAYQGLLVCWWCVSVFAGVCPGGVSVLCCVSVFAGVCQGVSVSCGVCQEMSDHEGLYHVIRWLCVNCTV